MKIVLNYQCFKMKEETSEIVISFDDFYEEFKPKRNPIEATSPYQNTLIEFDDFGEELIMEENQLNVWTLLETLHGFRLIPGSMLVRNVIGFFICKEKWDKGEKGYILQ